MLTEAEKLAAAVKALTDIGEIAVEPGVDPMTAVRQMQAIADHALFAIDPARK